MSGTNSLQALQSALTPKTGMQRIPFPLESYQHPSVPLSAKHLLNLFAEQQPADARTQAALIPTPGLRLHEGISAGIVGTGPIVAMNGDLPGRIYIVSGSHFYRVSAHPDGTNSVDDLGEIGTPTIPDLENWVQTVTIAVGILTAVVCVPPKAYAASHDIGDLSLTELSANADWPEDIAAISVAYLNGYFVFATPGSMFFTTQLLDTTFDALDFASIDGVPNTVNMLVSHRGELWFMGAAGIEVWYDSGDADFPFRRRIAIPYGNIQPHSVALGDGSVFWVGSSQLVFRSSGYNAVRIGTNAIEALIGELLPVVSSLIYSHNGHTFYVLNFASRTLVYDCSTQMWHDRASGADGVGRWRVNASVQIGGPILGDVLSGRIFLVDGNSTTEDGMAMLRQLQTPPLWGGTRRAFCARLEVEMETGTALSSGDVQVAWSDDGGTTWTTARTLTAGPAGALRKRVFTTRLGSFRQRVFRITAAGSPTIYAVDCDITAGVS